MTSENFNIILTNDFLDEDGDNLEIDTITGILKFRFPKGITFPADACIEIQNFCCTEEFPQGPRVVSIEEFNTQTYFGNAYTGTMVQGFLTTLNGDIKNKSQSGKIFLNNSESFQVQELTMRIQDLSGKKASFNNIDASDYYDLKTVNTWIREAGDVPYTAERLDETHWKLVGTGNTYILEFETPTTGTVGGNQSSTFVLDPTPQVPQDDPSLTLNLQGGTIHEFTPNTGAGLTSEIEKQGDVNVFSMTLAVSSKKNTY